MGVERPVVDYCGISPCKSREGIPLHYDLPRRRLNVRGILRHIAGQHSQRLRLEHIPSRHQLLVRVLGAVRRQPCLICIARIASCSAADRLDELRQTGTARRIENFLRRTGFRYHAVDDEMHAIRQLPREIHLVRDDDHRSSFFR
jgi:hypothetical protein